MFDSKDAPTLLPDLGFYYHNKRSADAPVTMHAYELTAVGYHTETGEYTALYRPLYTDAFAYQNGKLIYSRPLAMFVDSVEKVGEQVPRFMRITDSEVIAQLIKIRDQMYPSTF